MKSPAARKYCEKTHPEILIVPVCCVANVSRLADSKAGQALILHRLVEIWGKDYVKGVIDSIPWGHQWPEMRFDSLIACLPDDVVE